MVSPPFATVVCVDATSLAATVMIGAEGAVASTVTTNGEDMTVLLVVLVLAVAVKVKVPSPSVGTKLKIPGVEVSVAKPRDIPSLKTSTLPPGGAEIIRIGAVLLVRPFEGRFALMMGFANGGKN